MYALLYYYIYIFGIDCLKSNLIIRFYYQKNVSTLNSFSVTASVLCFKFPGKGRWVRKIITLSKICWFASLMHSFVSPFSYWYTLFCKCFVCISIIRQEISAMFIKRLQIPENLNINGLYQKFKFLKVFPKLYQQSSWMYLHMLKSIFKVQTRKYL